MSTMIQDRAKQCKLAATHFCEKKKRRQRMRQIQVSTVTHRPTASGSLRWTKLERSVSAGVVLLALHPFGALPAEAVQGERGAAIYTLRCAGCHGEELRNVSGGGSLD